MKKIAISVIVSILIMLMATTIYAAVTASAVLTASSQTVKPGDEVILKLNIKDISAGTDGLMGVQLKIDYDKAKFETLTSDSIKGLSGLTAYYNESTQGNILIAAGMSGIMSDSDFVQLTFRVKEGITDNKLAVTFKDIEVYNLEKANLGSKSVELTVVNDSNNQGGSESTPTPSTKPGETPTPERTTNTTPTPTTITNKDDGSNQGNLPITNIDTNTSSGGTTTKTAASGTGTTIKTTSSNSLPKAGIGSTIAILFVIVIGIGIISYIKLKKYKEI